MGGGVRVDFFFFFLGGGGGRVGSGWSISLTTLFVSEFAGLN